jgi:hypothetical protein
MLVLTKAATTVLSSISSLGSKRRAYVAAD